MPLNPCPESKVIQSIRLEGSPWQIGFSPDGKTLLIVGNDNSRAIFLFQHEKREEDGKETWSRLDSPKHSLEQGNAVSQPTAQIALSASHQRAVNHGFLLAELGDGTGDGLYRRLDEDF